MTQEDLFSSSVAASSGGSWPGRKAGRPQHVNLIHTCTYTYIHTFIKSTFLHHYCACCTMIFNKPTTSRERFCTWYKDDVFGTENGTRAGESYILQLITNNQPARLYFDIETYVEGNYNCHPHISFNYNYFLMCFVFNF